MTSKNHSNKTDKLFAAAIIAILSAVYIVCTCVRITATASPKPVFTVVIDAGHGGIDGGVSGKTSGARESELNLDIARKLKDRVESAGAKVVMTRKTEAGLYGIFSKGFKKRDMRKRMEIANGADPTIFVSIHLNYFSSPARRGAQIFYKCGDAESEILASKIQSGLNLLYNKNYAPLSGDFYVLNESKSTAVLCECGFLSNEEDEKLLLTDEYREKITEKIYEGIEFYRYNAASENV